VTYLRNYEAIDLQKKKWTLLVAAMRECSTRVLGSVIGPDEATAAVLWCDGL